MQQTGVELEKILITHGHIDHCGEAGILAKELGLPIEGPHEADRFWIDRLGEDGKKYGVNGQVFEPDRWLSDGDTVTVGELVLEVFHCPGHTPGHVVFFHRAEQIRGGRRCPVPGQHRADRFSAGQPPGSARRDHRKIVAAGRRRHLHPGPRPDQHLRPGTQDQRLRQRLRVAEKPSRFRRPAAAQPPTLHTHRRPAPPRSLRPSRVSRVTHGADTKRPQRRAFLHPCRMHAPSVRAYRPTATNASHGRPFARQLDHRDQHQHEGGVLDKVELRAHPAAQRSLPPSPPLTQSARGSGRRGSTARLIRYRRGCCSVSVTGEKSHMILSPLCCRCGPSDGGQLGCRTACKAEICYSAAPSRHRTEPEHARTCACQAFA